MITVRVHPNFLLGLLTQGKTTAPLRVRAGIPDGCILAGSRYDIHRGVLLLDFIDGKPGNKEIEVIFDVAVQVPS